MSEFEYFYGAEAEHFIFFRIPKVLITDVRFRAMSTDSKLLYGLMLDRMGLSVKNGWVDEHNRVYIIYTMEEIIDDKGEPNHNSRNDGEHENCIHIYNVANPAIYGSKRFAWNDMFFDNTYPNEEDNFSINTVGFICEWDNMNKEKTTSFGSTVSDWAREEVEEAYKNELIPETIIGENLTEHIDRAEFAAIAITLLEELTGREYQVRGSSPFDDISDHEDYEYIVKAYNASITSGTSKNTFEPDIDITREQLATMLCRVIKSYGDQEYTIENDANYYLDTSGVKYFADDSDISDYAKPSVYYMTKFGIIKGVDETHFAPKNITAKQEADGYATATREQAVLLSLRIFKVSDLWK